MIRVSDFVFQKPDDRIYLSIRFRCIRLVIRFIRCARLIRFTRFVRGIRRSLRREFIRRCHHLDLPVAHLHNLFPAIIVYGKFYIVAVIISVYSFSLIQDVSLSRDQLAGEFELSGLIGRPLGYLVRLIIRIGMIRLRGFLFAFVDSQGCACEHFACRGVHFLNLHIGRSIFHAYDVSDDLNRFLHALG